MRRKYVIQLKQCIHTNYKIQLRDTRHSNKCPRMFSQSRSFLHQSFIFHLSCFFQELKINTRKYYYVYMQETQCLQVQCHHFRYQANLYSQVEYSRQSSATLIGIAGILETCNNAGFQPYVPGKFSRKLKCFFFCSQPSL